MVKNPGESLYLLIVHPLAKCHYVSIAFNWLTKVNHFTGSAVLNKHIFNQLSVQPTYWSTGGNIITMQ